MARKLSPSRTRPRMALLGALVFTAILGTFADLAYAEGPSIRHYTWFQGLARDYSALDSVPRFREEGARGRLRCDSSELVTYRSRELRYAARVHPSFVTRLEAFENVIERLAIEHYGRAPRRLIHRGAYACRSARGRRGRISEHALGNALDFQGLDFGHLPRRAETPDAMPRRMRRGFRLRISQHWQPRRARDDYHAVFLHRLAEELRRSPDIFRGIVGPPQRRHRDHLHLDAAPWQYAMFGYDPVETDSTRDSQ